MNRQQYIKILRKVLNDCGYKHILLNYGDYNYTSYSPDRFIHINFTQLNNISNLNRLLRGHNVKNFYLIVLLHEVAHIKYRQKHVNKLYNDKYGYLDDIREKICDRYARQIYKKLNPIYFKNKKYIL